MTNLILGQTLDVSTETKLRLSLSYKVTKGCSPVVVKLCWSD